MKKPTTDDVNAYAARMVREGHTTAPDCVEAFINYYQSNGWKVGRVAMKSWTHAFRNWVKRDLDFHGKQQPDIFSAAERNQQQATEAIIRARKYILPRLGYSKHEIFQMTDQQAVARAAAGKPNNRGDGELTA